MQSKKNLHIAGFDVNVIKKTNVKNLYLKVCSPDGSVRVTVPYFTTDAKVAQFVQSRARFIERSQKRIRLQAQRDGHTYTTGETFYLWGEPLTLQVVEADNKRIEVQQDQDKLILRTPKNSDNTQTASDLKTPPDSSKISSTSTIALREKKINDWYRARLKEAISLKAPVIEAKIGVSASEYRIKNMKTRWGTCNTKTARVWVNLQLAKKPPECLDYLLTHELCHLLERNHTKRFWALVKQFYPQWRESKKTLDETIV